MSPSSAWWYGREDTGTYNTGAANSGTLTTSVDLTGYAEAGRHSRSGASWLTATFDRTAFRRRSTARWIASSNRTERTAHGRAVGGPDGMPGQIVQVGSTSTRSISSERLRGGKSMTSGSWAAQANDGFMLRSPESDRRLCASHRAVHRQSVSTVGRSPVGIGTERCEFERAKPCAHTYLEPGRTVMPRCAPRPVRRHH
jgi:hypothetical protein